MIHIFVLLGGLYGIDGWVDSTGMVSLASRLSKMDNTVVRTFPWSDFEQVTREVNEVPVTDKVVLVGYSGGGSRATWIANSARRAINLIIAYDPSPTWQVQHLPSRVKKAVCYYNSTPMMLGLGGGKLTGDHVETFEIKEQHLAVQFDERLHEITVARIEEE